MKRKEGRYKGEWYLEWTRKNGGNFRRVDGLDSGLDSGS